MLILSARAALTMLSNVGTTHPYQGGSVRLLSLHGWLSVSDSTWGTPIPTVAVRWGESECHVALAVPLPDHAIDAVETARAGGDVHFQMFLAGMSQVASAPPNDPQGRQGAVATGRWTEVVPILPANGSDLTGAWDLRVPREHWLGLLTQAGRQRCLVELPVPALPERQNAWSETRRHLQAATDAHRSGRYEDVLKSCRQVVDGIAAVLAEQWGVPQGAKGYPQWVREVVGRLADAWSKDDAGQAKVIGALLEGTWAWSSPSHHYGTGVPAREEAAFALHLATALLTFAAQLLDAHPQPVSAQ